MKNAFAIAALVATMVASQAWCACGKDPECDDLAAWSGIRTFNLSYSQPGAPGANRWHGRIDAKTNDLLIGIDIEGRQPMKGDVGMVGGYVMLSRGIQMPKGAEIDALDGPVLTLRLATAILSRLYPEGPASIREDRSIDRTFKAGVKFATPSAEGYVAPPWRVQGKVARDAKDSIVFDLTITAPSDAKGNTYVQKLSGDVSMQGPAVFDDSMSLEGWTIYGVGVQVESHGGSTTYDYGAKPQASPRARTIADIRAEVAQERSPGIKDPTKEFTGFWKTKCEEAFGLQIIHHGPEGKYVLVFCGPGGCGDPDDERETFITGDKHYRVVSEDEIVMRHPSGDDTYKRCTKDTHPVLKY